MIRVGNIRFGQYAFYELTDIVTDYEPTTKTSVEVVGSYDKRIEQTFNISRDVMEERFKDGDKCFIYLEYNIPIGMMWGHCGSCYIRGAGIPIIQNKDTIYWFWIYTLPQARGKEVYKKLKEYFFNYYHSAKKYTALVEPSNNIMIKEINKLGFKESIRYKYIKLNNITLVYEINHNQYYSKFKIELGNKHKLPVI